LSAIVTDNTVENGRAAASAVRQLSKLECSRHSEKRVRWALSCQLHCQGKFRLF